MFVVCKELSTAFSPFTPIAPPAEVLTLSQPEPGQLTDGSARLAAVAVLGARVPEDPAWDRALWAGMACGAESAPACRLGAAWLADAEDPVENPVDGPLSSEQPLAQPVAAGPAKVGENCPKLFVVTVLAWAAAALPVAASRAPDATAIVSNVARLRMRLQRMARRSLPECGSHLRHSICLAGQT
jgi:hypothetical protein